MIFILYQDIFHRKGQYSSYSGEDRRVIFSVGLGSHLVTCPGQQTGEELPPLCFLCHDGR